jgi:hypothetical protein
MRPRRKGNINEKPSNPRPITPPPAQRALGIDLGNSKDYGCEVKGYRCKDGKIIITKVTHTREVIQCKHTL